MILYTIDGCLDCQHWREELKDHHLVFEERNLLTDDQAADDLLASIGEIKVPALLCHQKQLSLSSALVCSG